MLNLITAGSTSILSLSEAREHLRVTLTDEDTFISSLCVVAQEYIERATGLDFKGNTWEEVYHCFPYGGLELIRYPLQSVSSVKYYDGSNVLQTWSSSNYHVLTPTYTQGDIQPVHNVDWPEVYTRPDAVKVRYVTGFSSIPPMAKHAARLLVGHWFLHRESEGQVTKELEVGVERLLRLLDYRGYK